MDICAYFDEKERFGPTGLIKAATGREDIKKWQKSVQNSMRMLTGPRYMKSVLPEFMQQDARDAFVKNHQMPPYEKVASRWLWRVSQGAWLPVVSPWLLAACVPYPQLATTPRVCACMPRIRCAGPVEER